jgi:hypothetical protein
MVQKPADGKISIFGMLISSHVLSGNWSPGSCKIHLEINLMGFSTFDHTVLCTANMEKVGSPSYVCWLIPSTIYHKR